VKAKVINLRSRDGSLLGLSVRKLRSSTSGAGTGNLGADNVDGDLVALVAFALRVEVVEVTAQALMEDGGAANGEGAVGASRPTSSVDGTSLGRAIELELVVGGDVTSALLGVGEHTVLEGDLKLLGVVLLPLWRLLV
jgi:hypothetical protein